MANVGNWVGQYTNTVGAGTIVLSATLPGYTSFASITGGASAEFWYAIVDGDNREAGVGTYNNGFFSRDTVMATIENGQYYGSAAAPIQLSGNAQIFCTFNKTAFDQIFSHISNSNIHFPDAPADGTEYARKDQTWVPATGGGGGGSGGSTTAEINQVNHGFAPLDAIYFDGAEWKKAIASDALTMASGVVVKVANVDQFTYAQAGRFTVPSTGLTPGNYYFLSPTTAGGYVDEEPAYSQPLIFIEDDTTILVVPYRPFTQGPDSGATATWGYIIGTLSNQADLQAALDEKADALPAGTEGQILRYGVSGLEATSDLYISSNKNVGIHNTDPDTVLGAGINGLVLGSGNAPIYLTLFPGITGVGQIAFYKSGSDAIRGGIKYDNATDIMTIRSKSVNSLFIRDTGVGIGVDPSTYNLRVYTFTGNAIVIAERAGSSGSAEFRVKNSVSTWRAGIGVTNSSGWYQIYSDQTAKTPFQIEHTLNTVLFEAQDPDVAQFRNGAGSTAAIRIFDLNTTISPYIGAEGNNFIIGRWGGDHDLGSFRSLSAVGEAEFPAQRFG